MFELEILNFQSIAHARLPIRDFTSIIGPSNRGKSAVIRALRAILYNELHPSFIRHGAKECTLRLHFDDKTPHNLKTVEFTKGPAKNVYTLTFKDGTTKAYPKAGNSTPDELQELGFTLLTTERDDSFNLNFQGQLEPLFLVAETPTTLTSFMNKVFQIEQYERALRNMSTDLVQLGRDYDKLGADITAKERQHAELTESVTTTTQQRNTLQAAFTALTQTETQADAVAKAIATWQAALESEQLLTAMRRKHATLKAAHATVEALVQAATLHQRATQLSTTLRTAHTQHTERRTAQTFYTAAHQHLVGLTQHFASYQRVVALSSQLQHLTAAHSAAHAQLTPRRKWVEDITTVGTALKQYYQSRLAHTQLTQQAAAHAATTQQRALVTDADQKLAALHTTLGQFTRARSARLNLDAGAMQLATLNTAKTQLETARTETTALEHAWHDSIGHCPLCGNNYHGTTK